MSADLRPRGELIADAARHAIGTRFRLHGRDPAHGLDCIGLAGLCLSSAGIGCDLPNGYRLRGGSVEQMVQSAERAGLLTLDGTAQMRAGDILLVSVRAIQLHLLIVARGGDRPTLIHADAGMGRVVCIPMLPADWRGLALFRVPDTHGSISNERNG